MCDERGRVSESIQKSVRWRGRAGGGESSTHETWVGLVSGRRLRPVLDLGAGCACSLKSWERTTWFLTSTLDVHVRRAQSWERMAYEAHVKPVSGRRFRPVLGLGAGCARSVQSWERSVGEAQGGPSGGGSSARSLISAVECT
jgi:hypothetical protein